MLAFLYSSKDVLALSIYFLHLGLLVASYESDPILMLHHVFSHLCKTYIRRFRKF